MHASFPGGRGSDAAVSTYEEARPQVQGASGGMPRTLVSLGHPQYRLYFVAMICQTFAMNMQMMARTWFLYRLTGSGTVLGLMGVANAVPMLFLSPVGGLLADRYPKRTLLMGALFCQGLIALGIALLTAAELITWVHLLIAAALHGCVMAMTMPARQALIIELVGRERLTNAVALVNAEMNLNRMLAPAVAGFLIAQAGVAAVFFVMMSLDFLGVFFVTLLRPTTRPADLAPASAGRQIADGLRYARQDRTVFVLLLFTLSTVVLSTPYQTLLPMFTEDILNIGPEGMGILMSFAGFGALGGSLVVASLADQNRGVIFIGSSALLGVFLVLFSFSQSLELSLAMMVGVGAGQAGRQALSNILVQHYVEDAYRGRVMSILMMEWGITSFITLPIAIMAEAAGVQWAVGGAAALLIAACAWAMTLGRLRTLA